MTCLKLFEADPATEAILMMGEIGGTAEEEAAAFVKQHVTKPVAAFIAGRAAPAGKRMGHAGAIISGGKGTAAEKIAALEAAGIEVAQSPADMGTAMQRAIARKKHRNAPDFLRHARSHARHFSFIRAPVQEKL